LLITVVVVPAVVVRLTRAVTAAEPVTLTRYSVPLMMVENTPERAVDACVRDVE